MSKKSYTAEQFDHVEGLEAVQLRPGMFVGDAGDGAVEVLFREVLDNSIDEAMNGYGDLIEVVVQSNGYTTISDRGRGIPIEPHPKHPSLSVLEVVLTKLHSGAKLRGEYGVSGGLHGIGLKALTALSDSLQVSVRRGDGKVSSIRFEHGVKQGDIATTKLSSPTDYKTGTSITWKLSKKFLPDATNLQISREAIRRMLRERSYMNAGLRLTLKWEDDKVESFYEKDGLAAFVLSLAGDGVLFKKASHFTNEAGSELPVEVAVAWTGSFGRDNLQGFCNCVRQPDGGTHLQGLRMSLPGVIRSYIEVNGLLVGKDKDIKIESSDCFEGVYALVAVRHRNPVFKGQAKTAIANTDIQGAVQKTVNAGLAQWLEENPKEAKVICQRVIAAAKARIAASKAREQVRKQDAGVVGMKNFGKLKDCSSKESIFNELFIVEGDSAGGSAAMARNRQTQAIYSLKGKPLNSWECDQSKIFSNAELSDLTCAIGTGLFSPEMTAEEVDAAMTKLRYGKVIIMADADIDGCLVSTTLVQTINGPKPFFRLVQEAEAGLTNYGFAVDAENNVVQVELRLPRETKRVDELVCVTMSDGIVFCTPEHPFLTDEGDYVPAAQLAPGTNLRSTNGVNVLSAVHTKIQSGKVPVYDLTVDLYHNFQLANGVFVHNSHIECLLLGYMFRHCRPLIERGHVYIALPPLFRVTEKGKHTFLKDEAALSAFFKKRAKAIVGSDPLLLALAGGGMAIASQLEVLAGATGLAPSDIAHALRATATYDKEREDWLMAYAERIVEIREAECEGVSASEVDSGAIVVSGLEASGRYFTSVIDEAFFHTAAQAWGAVCAVVGSDAAFDLVGRDTIAVGDVACSDLYTAAKEIEKASRKGINVQRNKGLIH